MRKIKILLGAFAVLVLAQKLYSQNTVLWEGDYSYSANYGNNAAGTTMSVSYFLHINNEGALPNAILISEGYQTDDTIYCNCIFRNDSAFFFFRNYSNGSVKNEYGIEQYSPNKLLFTFVQINYKQSHKGAKRIITIWGAFNSDDKKKFAFVELAK